MAERAVAAIARVAGPTPPPPDPDSTDMLARDPIDAGVNLVAATLGMTSGGAQSRVDVARAITESLPKCQRGDGGGVHGVLASPGRRAGGRPMRALTRPGDRRG